MIMMYLILQYRFKILTTKKEWERSAVGLFLSLSLSLSLSHKVDNFLLIHFQLIESNRA